MAVLLFAWGAVAQSFRVQCPTNTTLHQPLTDGTSNPGIKCQQISGGDGFATMGDGTQTYLFGFGPLSGLADIGPRFAGHAAGVGVQRRQQPQPAQYRRSTTRLCLQWRDRSRP